ncbi:zinc phosphodiesterase ELAC protein 1-like [Cimex lectularius]|uniref:Metallo-beta-lactamase domain-containing protein n=1 Tax=Cimex lectularius TaxID=79782 RepID=A0A8I6R7V8_CIMLE|nr:zinc phosphodiesterase ELAC protein 1-like [Cimex lectularius]
MQLIFLGTASCYPTAHRGVSCTALRLDDGNVWIFDCGEGSQVQIQKSSVLPGKIKKIFITHLHGDHLFGLPGLVCTLGCQVQDRKEPFILDIYGPLGLRRYLRESLKLSVSPLPFKYKVHELVPFDFKGTLFESQEWQIAVGSLHPQEELGDTIYEKQGVWNVMLENNISVYAGPLVHRIPCFGYVVKESPSPGALNVLQLKKEGVPPGPLYKQIKDGHPIALPSGKIIIPEEVLGPPKPGRCITILGDTCDSSALKDIAINSDVLVHEATLEESMKDKAIEHGHSTPVMAVSFAESIAAKKLILFHFSQRYKRDTGEAGEDGDNNTSVNILHKEAELECNKRNFICDIMLAEDLLEIDVKRPVPK